MQVGDVVHLDGLKAEYSLYGKDRFTSCTLPDGNYVVVDIDDGYIRLAWRELSGSASRKHRYRVSRAMLGVIHHA